MTTHKRACTEVPDWVVERYLLGELPGEESRMMDALHCGPELEERLAALERSNAELLRRHPPSALAAAVRSKPARPQVAAIDRAQRRPLLVAALAVAAATGVAVWAPWVPSRPAADDVTRVKGLTPYLLLYRQAAADVERLLPSAIARDHDVVQLAYQAGARRYGVIVSIDGRGVVTRHLPLTGSDAAPLTAGTAVPLPQFYELDDAPGFERFVLLTADEPFPVESVVAAVRRQYASSGPREPAERRLDLPGAMDQFNFVLRKESIP